MRLQEMYRLVAVAGVAVAWAFSAPTRASLIYSDTGPVVVPGSETPNEGFTPTFSVTVQFTAVPTVDSGVIVDELGQPTPNIGWHDSQVELATDGSVHASVWPFSINAGGELNLGAAQSGLNVVKYSYDSSAATISGQLNGGAVVSIGYVRQDPIGSGGQPNQIWAFGVVDNTSQAGAPNPYTNTIQSVQIYNDSGLHAPLVPEPATATLLGGLGFGLLFRRRSSR